jgi:cell division inhibitor SepF
MAGAMRRMGQYLGLVEEDDYADYPDYDSHERERVPARREDYAESRYAREESADSYGPTTYAADEPVQSMPLSQITAVHPRTYNEARTIGEHFRKGTPVIMNLTDMEDADAKRLVDFAAGLTFGLRGRIERVTAKVFLLSPANITVTASERAKALETGFFNQS